MMRIFLCAFGLSFLSVAPLGAQNEQEVLTSFFDSLVLARVQAGEAPGLLLAIVRDTQVLVLRGYGRADLETQEAFDPESTIVPLGSLSKLVTSAAVLQQVALGRLGLSNDVGAYLGAGRPRRTYPGDLTLRQLLTHSSGFDESGIGRSARRPAELIPLEQWVMDYPPPQAFPPGQAYRYSNYAFSLAGYLVEKASGLSFAEYAEQNIFGPLDMQNSSFRPGAPITAKAYRLGAGRKEQLPAEYSHDLPARGMVSGARDMARFMQAVLGSGDSLLPPAMRIDWLSQQFSASPSPNGMAFGFHEGLRRQVRILDQVGYHGGFSSYLMLVPGLRLGLFVAQNGGQVNLCEEVAEALIRQVLPEPFPGEGGIRPNPLYARFNAADYTGRYRHLNYPQRSLSALPYLLGFSGIYLRVEAAGPGALQFNGERYLIQQPELFVDENNGFLSWQFRKGKGGRRVVAAGRDVYERLNWWEYPWVLPSVLGFSLLLACWNLIWSRIPRAAEPQGAIRLRRLSHLASAAWFLGLFSLAGGMALTAAEWSFGLPLGMYVALGLAAFGALSGLLLLPAAVLGWRHGWWSLGSRVLLSVQVLSWGAGLGLGLLG